MLIRLCIYALIGLVPVGLFSKYVVWPKFKNYLLRQVAKENMNRLCGDCSNMVTDADPTKTLVGNTWYHGNCFTKLLKGIQ